MNPPFDPNQQQDQPTHAVPQIPQAPNPLANYQFSSDELRVLRECNTESFFQRALPLGTGMGVAAFLAIRSGHLKPHVKYGAVPKVVVSCIVGYFLGKFSYQTKCAEKIMRLPNSHLAEVLRQRKQRGGMMGGMTPDMGLPFTSASVDVYSDENIRDTNRSTSLNLDMESRPTYSGLDDIYRPSLDNPITMVDPEIPIAAVKPGTSYEDLRRRNREEYAKKQQNPYHMSLPPDGPIVVRERTKPSQQQEAEFPETRKGKTNKYGDTWEN